MSESVPTAAPAFDLQTLEFQAVRTLLLERLQSPLGRTAVEKLAPLPDADAARRALSLAAGLADRLAENDPAPMTGATEVRSWLVPFFAGEHHAQSRDLAELKRLLRAAVRCRQWLQRSPAPAVLSDFALEMPEMTDLVSELERMVDDRGEVLDTASPRLAELRRGIDAARAGVDAAVQRFLSQPDVHRYLQSPEPAWRHDRPVFQVRQEHRQKISGVLHDRSQSGATLFVEPDSVVEAANVLSDAQAAAQREVEVVLAHAARGLQRCRDEIDGAITWVAELDLGTAKARCIVDDGYLVPEVAATGSLCLHDARHPLLLQALDRGQELVPLSVTLGDPHRVLVITGPNTGGKTVALKTIGLLALMAMSGVPIPSGPGSRVPFFRAVKADIGDAQGISQNLSTFSSHVGRIAGALAAAGERSLILLDELGAGTDPEEGGVLGFAVLEELLSGHSYAAVTTHLGRLKDFAYRHPGAENGSMAFDGESLEPLFRLEVGIPGSSHALDIAGRVGMPGAVVARARELLGDRDQRLEEMISQVQRARADAEQDRQRTADLTRQAERDGQALTDKLREAERRDTWLAEEADAVIEEELRSAQAAMGELLRDLANAPAAHGARARQLQEVVDGLLRRGSLHRRRMRFCGGLRRGDGVYLPRWGRRAVVRKVDKAREVVVVEYGRMQMEVPFEDVSWIQPLRD